MSGKCSPTCTPGTLVGTGRKGPRTASGASGLRSQVSSWLGPPTRNSRMQLTSPALPAAAAGWAGRRRAGGAGGEGADGKEVAPRQAVAALDPLVALET